MSVCEVKTHKVTDDCFISPHSEPGGQLWKEAMVRTMTQLVKEFSENVCKRLTDLKTRHARERLLLRNRLKRLDMNRQKTSGLSSGLSTC